MTAAGKPVFLSYARDASRAHARALHEALGDDLAFLDTADIATGDLFAARLREALLDARVVVVFAEPAYFTRWYCLLEFRAARTPFLRLAASPESTPEARDEALRALVLALPATGVGEELDRFPPLARVTSWPRVDQTDELARLVHERLAGNPPTLRERYAALGGDGGEAFLLDGAARLPPPRPPGGVPLVPRTGLPPSLGDAFVGRADDLWRVHDALLTVRGTPGAAGVVASLQGSGGVGKTRLALEYLHRFGVRAFGGGVFWIDAEQQAEPQLYAVLQALEPSAPPPEALRDGYPGGVSAALAAAVRGLPSGHPPLLFVVDGIPEPPAGAPPLPLSTWCPVHGEVAVLATSRRTLTLQEGHVVPVALSPLDPDASVHLLRPPALAARLGEGEWRELAAWVGWLPLALVLMRHALETGALSPEALLRHSRSRSITAVLDRAARALRGSVPAGTARGVAAAFSASYRRLSRRERRAARMLAWLAPSPVAERLLDAAPRAFTPAVRARLRGAHFMGPAAGAGEPAFGAMHAVLGDYLRTTSRWTWVDVYRVADALLEATRLPASGGNERMALVRALAPSLRALTEHVAHRLEHGRFPARNVWEVMVVDVNNCALWLSEAGEPETARWCFTRLLAALRSASPRSPLTLLLRNNLAASLSNGQLGRPEVDAVKEVLAGARRLYWWWPSRMLRMQLNLVDTLVGEERYGEALEYAEDALRRAEKHLSPGSFVTLTAMFYVGAVRAELGEVEAGTALVRAAAERGAAALAGRRRWSLMEAQLLVMFATRLGMLLVRGGRTDEGLENLEEALGFSKTHLGDAHHDTLDAAADLGSALLDASRPAPARDHVEKWLPAAEEALGRDHSTTRRLILLLARALGGLGEVEAARALLAEVLAPSAGVVDGGRGEPAVTREQAVDGVPAPGRADGGG